MDGKIEKKRYYIMSKKIYSRRFSTDCFSDYFDDMARQAPVGLDGYLEYATEKASVEELKSQHSYFIDSLYRDVDDGAYDLPREQSLFRRQSLYRDSTHQPSAVQAS